MFSSDKWFGGSADFYTTKIDQSLRYNYADSPYLSRTADSGNRRTFTFSSWFKRSSFNNTNSIFGATLNGSNFFALRFRDTDDPDGGKLQIANYSGSFDMDLRTSQVFRDSTNWYHIVVAVDTTQSTSSDRVKLYVNGSQVTSFSTETYPSQNFETRVSNGHTETVGAEATSYSYIDGYLAEVNFIDGTALAPSSFGETKNGVWIPKAISGLTYGTNGYRLTFADSSALGDDTSGNGNDFTSSGLASTDVVPDSPTNNFCTFNLLDPTNMTLAEGNLETDKASNASNDGVNGTFLLTSGKWYFEFKPKYFSSGSGAFANVGVRNPSGSAKDALGSGNATNATVLYLFDGNVQDFNSDTTYFPTGGSGHTYGATGAEYIYGVALDMDNGKIWFSINGTYPNSGNPATGANEARDDINTNHPDGVFPAISSYNVAIIANFGQNPSFNGDVGNSGHTAGTESDSNGIGLFKYAPPTGFLAVCSSNLPDTTLSPNQDEQADDHFNNLIYTGDGSSSKAITGVGFQPDWVWIKANGSSKPHGLHDSSRVISGNEEIWYTNSTAAGNTGGAYISSFDSDGFTLNNNTSGNASGVIHAAWNWKATGGTLTSNSNGSITSETQANTDAGLSIVTWTGNQTNGASVGHGLGVVPELVIIKNRDSSQGSVVNVNLSSKYRLNFNSDAGNYGDFTYYNGTYTSDNIVFNNAHGAWNGNTDKMVSYVFHSVLGYSKIGTYTGTNSSGDNAFIYTGFRPKFIIIKNVSTSADWIIRDDLHSGYYTDGRGNSVNIGFEPNEDNALTGGSGTAIDFVSNGFKIRNNDTRVGASNTYFYYAIAENPFKFNNAR